MFDIIERTQDIIPKIMNESPNIESNDYITLTSGIKYLTADLYHRRFYLHHIYNLDKYLGKRKLKEKANDIRIIYCNSYKQYTSIDEFMNDESFNDNMAFILQGKHIRKIKYVLDMAIHTLQDWFNKTVELATDRNNQFIVKIVDCTEENKFEPCNASKKIVEILLKRTELQMSKSN